MEGGFLIPNFSRKWCQFLCFAWRASQDFVGWCGRRVVDPCRFWAGVLLFGGKWELKPPTIPNTIDRRGLARYYSFFREWSFWISESFESRWLFWPTLPVSWPTKSCCHLAKNPEENPFLRKCPQMSSWDSLTIINWLVVEPTHLKNTIQNGNLPQKGVKIKNIGNHQLVKLHILEDHPDWNFS